MTELHIETGRFSCPVCTQRFHSLGDKKRHIRTEHSKEES